MTKDANIIHEGGCQCRAHRFEASGTPIFICKCHCKSCRKATGAAFSSWVGFKDNQVRWITNEPPFYTSSPGVRRGFCANCGTPLTYAGKNWAGETHFLIGVFNDPSEFIPGKNVFTEDALSWAIE